MGYKSTKVSILADQDYKDLKRLSKAQLEFLSTSNRICLIKAAYRVSKGLFDGNERLQGFWEAIANNINIARGLYEF